MTTTLRVARPRLDGRRWPRRPSARESALVADVLASCVWTDGPWTAAVERRMSELTGAPYAVAFNSCTSALHAALHALGCGQGSCVAVPSLTFAGTVTGARHIGADLRFTDVDAGTLTAVPSTVPPPGDADLVLPVDLHGVPHGLDRTSVAGRPVLTDACQSLGTRIAGHHVGAAGVHAWSFSAAKLVAAPDGGAVTTGDADLAGLLRELRDYGVDAGQHRSNGAVVRPGGHNWRPSELSMAVVAGRLDGLPRWTARARDVTARLHAELDRLGLWRQHAPAGADVAWHKVRFGPADLDPDRGRRWETALAEAGVPTHRWGRTPLHRHPANGPGPVPRLPVTEAVAAATLCLGTEACPPLTWTDEETEHVCHVLASITEAET